MGLFTRRSLGVLIHHLTSWQQAIRDHTILETARNRSLTLAGIFLLSFTVIGLRLTEIMVLRSKGLTVSPQLAFSTEKPITRADIVDRNGDILATHLITGSIYANPKVIINAEEAAFKLSKLIPDLNYDTVLRKLKSEKGFTWLIRHIPPKIQNEVNQLGLPGIYLQRDEKRLYPFGNLLSHVLGYCGIDNLGLAGVEKYFDSQLRQNKEPLELSIDIRIQHMVHDELSQAVQHFKAEGGNAIVMSTKGEVIAMVSLPDYDPNLPNQNHVETTFNRNTLGLYESGSTFKIYNTAISLETKTAKITSIYDASTPIKVGRKSITDFKGKNRPLDLREIFIYSSNIGSAKMALDFGGEVQKQFLGRFGLLTAPQIELPEIGSPLVPRTWRDVTTMTIAYGYGIAVSPLQLITGVLSVITGVTRPATLIKRKEDYVPAYAETRVVSEKTSAQIRDLMRLVVTEGTAKKANVPGYNVIGKTGTAHKNKGKNYNNARLTSFIGAFPKDNPQYIMVLFLDNPQPTKETYGYATGGWNAAPTGGKIIARIAPLLGVEPDKSDSLDSKESSFLPLQHLVQTNDTN